MESTDKKIKIKVDKLRKCFGDLEVLKDISTEITEGEVVVILGPSGSGKSTFLRCLNRLEDATAGGKEKIQRVDAALQFCRKGVCGAGEAVWYG